MRAILAAASLVLAGCGATTSTVLVVRHAEKGSGPGRDPALTQAGRERAQALVEVARRAGVVAAYHTPYHRARQTVEPLAEALRIPLFEIPYTPEREGEHADAIALDIEKRFPGKPVIYAGHTTTIPAILLRLGVADPRLVPETEYGTVFIVTRSGVKATVAESRFGSD